MAELCCTQGISDTTFYAWRSKYGCVEVSDAERLKALEEGEPHAEETADHASARSSKHILP